tara:strand:- start:3289 stop:3510 length:222 start_codon:yes stop_codon:yes gene_type:complete
LLGQEIVHLQINQTQIIAGNNIINIKKSAARKIKDSSSEFAKMINPGLTACLLGREPIRTMIQDLVQERQHLS